MVKIEPQLVDHFPGSVRTLRPQPLGSPASQVGMDEGDPLPCHSMLVAGSTFLKPRLNKNKHVWECRFACEVRGLMRFLGPPV